MKWCHDLFGLRECYYLKVWGWGMKCEPPPPSRRKAGTRVRHAAAGWSQCFRRGNIVPFLGSLISFLGSSLILLRHCTVQYGTVFDESFHSICIVQYTFQ
ncbi:unnamed protein product [Discosporangium mesarthrocarpum]